MPFPTKPKTNKNNVYVHIELIEEEKTLATMNNEQWTSV